MKAIRAGCFETNSSTMHSINLCNASDYDKWVRGETVAHFNGEQVIFSAPKVKKGTKCPNKGCNYVTTSDNYQFCPKCGKRLVSIGPRYISYEQWKADKLSEYYGFEERYKPTFDIEVVAFGYYGENR